MNDIPANPDLCQLQNALEALRRAREQDQATIDSLKQEIEQLRRWVLALHKSSFSEEELRRWVTEENVDGVELEQFIGELETLVHDHSRKR